MMKRDIKALSGDEYDLLIVGGGIQGACVAREAALSGLKVALVERSDFGGATSANSLKILHGGLRYLQHFDFPRMVSSIQSRNFFAKLAPDLIQPLPCVIPTEKWGLKHPLPMWIGLTLNDLISYNRNRGLSDKVKIPSGKLLSTKACRALFPLVSEPFRYGGACWYDYLIVNSERLTLECLHQAVEHGACIANYVEVEDYLIEDGRVRGIKAKNLLESGAMLEVRARTVLNTVGPWWNKSLSLIADGDLPPLRFAKAVNLILNKSLLQNHAVGLESRDPENGNEKRFFFVVPWHQGTMIGTTYKPVESADPTLLKVDEAEIRSILDAIQPWFSGVALGPSDVALAHAGLLPIELKSKPNGQGYKLHEDTTIVNHELTHHLKGFFSIKTVKYTTSPFVAAKFVRMLIGKNKRLDDPCKSTVESEIPGESGGATPEWADTFRQRYGNRGAAVARFVSETPGADQLVCQGQALVTGELLYFIREEMAQHLEDMVLRRGATPGAKPPTISCLKRIADIAAAELKWDDTQVEREIGTVVDFYSSRGIVLKET